jgi:hypothetical protein
MSSSGASSVVNRARITVLVAVALMGGVLAAHAGPCAGEISQVEQQIRQLQAVAAPSGAGEPTAPQSIDAQLHHQPTPRAVESAASRANADGAAALDRARKADAEGDGSACTKALKDARQLYRID